MTEDSWEHRMAARAAERRVERERREAAKREAALAKARAAVDELIGREGFGWLNGWSRLEGDGLLGLSVLIGTDVRCVGCGRSFGITSVVFPEGWEPPGPEPEWPFARADCPVCQGDMADLPGWIAQFGRTDR